MKKIISEKEMLVLSHLRQNARETLTGLSRKTEIPVSTLFDRLNFYKKELIKKHSTLIDFAKIGFSARANIFLSVEKSQKEQMKEYLLKNQNTNSVYTLYNNFDFVAECIFKHIKELREFKEEIEEKFNIKSSQIHHIIEEVKREGFMDNPETIGLIKK